MEINFFIDKNLIIIVAVENCILLVKLHLKRIYDLLVDDWQIFIMSSCCKISLRKYFQTSYLFGIFIILTNSKLEIRLYKQIVSYFNNPAFEFLYSVTDKTQHFVIFYCHFNYSIRYTIFIIKELKK